MNLKYPEPRRCDCQETLHGHQVRIKTIAKRNIPVTMMVHRSIKRNDVSLCHCVSPG